jgi:hypothetical protein
MKHIILFAALLLCSNAQAATYVYQAKAYQHHGGKCRKALLPFQVTLTVRKAFPPNFSRMAVPLQSISIDAGGKLQWGEKFNKKHTDAASFATDLNGNITTWDVDAATRRRRWFATVNEPGSSVEDQVHFTRCYGENQNRPGSWTRTK